MWKSTRALVRAPMVCALVTCALQADIPAGWAGKYHVYSCRTPTEQVAPADGWTPSTSVASASVSARNTCASGGALVVELADGVKHEVGTAATWTFAAPAGESLAGATLWRAGEVEGGANANATYYFWLLLESTQSRQREPFSECVYISKCTGIVGDSETPSSSLNEVFMPQAPGGASVVRLYVTASCGGPSASYLCPEGKNDPAGYAAVVYLYAADLTLEEASQPTVTPGSVGGELATAATVSGTATLTFGAQDSGSGVYRATVWIDEKPVGSTVLDSNGGHCVDVDHTSDGLPAFLFLQPCAPSVSADVPLDTTAVPDGTHHLIVTVADAAGNSAVVLDRKIDVANRSASATGPAAGASSSTAGSGTGESSAGTSSATTASTSGSSGGGPALGAPNGSPASSQAILAARWRSSSSTTLSGRWGSAQRILGRLTTAGGAPIVGAALDVSATPASQGAAAHRLAAAVTDSKGRFSVRLSPASSSERIALAYRAHAGDAVPVATATLELSVPACLSLRIAPRVSQRGGTIAFAGLLRGGPIPPGGKQLVLQARAPGAEWRTFQAISTDRRGRYRSSYRFRLPGPITYRFRVLSRHEADFPFASGRSNAVAVRER